MKSLFTFLLILLAGKTALAQTVPSSCTPSTQLLQSYKNDVADLALQRIYEIGSPDTALIEIPQHYQDTIWQALAAVANTGAILEADSVFRNYCVHRWPQEAFGGSAFYLTLDTSYTWARRLYLGYSQTGNATVDSLMAQHGVVFGGQYYRVTIILNSSHVINLKAFMDRMLTFPGAFAAQKRTSAGDHSNMWYTVKNNNPQLQFKGAWGDCPAGCTAWKIWYYSVNLQTCAVALDSIDTRYANYLDDLYMPNCNGWPVSIAPVPLANKPSLTLFPNPAIATLQLRGLAGGTATYRVSDVAGSTLLEGVTATHQIDIAPLPAGFYLLTVRESTGGIYTRRFVKE